MNAPTPSPSGQKRVCCYPILTEPSVLVNYSHGLGLASSGAALSALAQALAASPQWQEMPGAVLVARLAPQPALAVVGCFDESSEASIGVQSQGLNRACEYLRYVSYSQAEQDCQKLATRLVECFGHRELHSFHFTAIPRGGLIVLGMLAYALGLERDQMETAPPADVPVVVIDDCALTGARWGRFMENCPNEQVIFAHLYSHPGLRAAIKSGEPRLVACLGARDLHDHGPKRLGREYPAWQNRWLERLDSPRYWVGQPEHICFAWNEPDRSIWNPVTQKVEDGWRAIPPDLCLNNKPKPGAKPIPVQIQPEGKGPLKPSDHVLFGDLDGQIVIGDLRTGASFGLTDVAADMWCAIVEYGSPETVAVELLDRYDVDKDMLLTDLYAFVDTLLSQGLLEKTNG